MCGRAWLSARFEWDEFMVRLLQMTPRTREQSKEHVTCSTSAKQRVWRLDHLVQTSMLCALHQPQYQSLSLATRSYLSRQPTCSLCIEQSGQVRCARPLCAPLTLVLHLCPPSRIPTTSPPMPLFVSAVCGLLGNCAIVLAAASFASDHLATATL